MISCNTCGGKVFVDMTFTDNRSYELFCLICGMRVFVNSGPVYKIIDRYVKESLNR